MTLKSRILDYVQATDYVSFAELGNRFGDDFQSGDRELLMGENIVLWSGMTEPGVTAIRELLEEGAIVPHPATMLVYLIDGRLLRLPIMKRVRKYKTPHWLPVTLRPAQKGQQP